MQLWKYLGKAVFWLTWPALKIKLAMSTRTRGAITYKNQLLVVKSWLGNNKWTLPGGGIENNEDSLVALIREIEEEVGLAIKVSNCKKLGVFTFNSTNLKYVYSLYHIKYLKKPKIIQNKYEIIEYCWVNKNKLNHNNSNSDVLQAVNSLK